ncbi:Modification methylase DpnIIA [Polaribacter huanghezhanensis]|uniref:DNA adenine methylase n=1 Tax=Polaribacter huanghezhanensis TaxID=1354726 RepID=UPI0026495A3A|nr:DNA adenine methylase [Polaribacter huanghezhanensis]WKD85219.1 Modification methylase DpnIIA [Polaribacter huanghezhanensis]
MPKTPITYYGGKINMVSTILPLIPKHRIYTESFFGGGAIFFAKEPSKAEVINDTNNMVVNFFEVVKTDFDRLKLKIEATLFSRASYTVANMIYKMPHLFDKIQQAWSFYIATNMGFSCQIGSWGYDKYGKRVKAFQNKKLLFNKDMYKRLENAQIENNNACKVISSRDTEDAFHYVDPPYIDANQGHYGGYTESDYKQLLDTLSKLKGKFLLSSYPSKLLDSYIQKNGWHTKTFDKPLSARKAVEGKSRGRKIEVLTANYSLNEIK